MSDLQNFLSNGGDAALRRVNTQAESAGSLFPDATWEQIGQNKQLTDFLHQSLDPNGSKYAGDSDAMKQDILNTTTAKGSSVLASVWDYAKATGENQQKKRFENLISRMYEQAPNRLFSGNLNDTTQAIGAGLLGGAIYDAPLLGLSSIAGKALGLGAKGLEAAGAKLLENSATKLAGTDLSAEAMGQASLQLARDATWTGAKRGALREGAENAAFGVGGDVAQQYANIERGNQTEVNTGQAVMAAILGGSIGAVAGGVGGAFEGRAMGKDLRAELPSQATSKVFDANVPKLLDSGTEIPAGYVSTADAHLEAVGKFKDAASDVSEFKNQVTAGTEGAKSRYTPDQLNAIESALADAWQANLMSDALMKQAVDLRAIGTPEAILEAGKIEQRAMAYEGLVKYINTVDSTHNGAFIDGGDVSQSLVNSLARYNPDLAKALGAVDEAPAPKASKTSKAPAANTASSASSAAAPTSEPTQAGAQGAPAAEVPPTPTQKVAEEAVAQPPQTPTAKDVESMAETKFSDDEKAAYSTLNDALSKSNMQLQDVITSMEKNGRDQAAADVAAASGVDRAVVKDSIDKVADATQREYDKQIVEHDAAVAAAKEKTVTDAAASLNKADADLKAAAASVADDLKAATEAAAATTQKIEELKAEATGLKDNLDAIQAAGAQYNLIKSNLDNQISEISDALDAALGNIKQEFDNNMNVSNGDKDFSKLTQADKLGIVHAVLKNLKEEFPDVAPLLDQLDESKLTSPRGVANAKLKLRELANHSISWTYAKAIGDVLPDAMNVEHFEVVLRAVLDTAPSEEVARISSAYHGFVKNALLERINAIGLKAVLADPSTGPAWQRLVNAEGGHQQFGGVSTVAGKFDIVSMANSYTGQLIDAAGKAKVSMGDTLREGLPAMVKVARDTMRMLRASGIPMDSKFMEEALHTRLRAAIREVVDRDFYKQNEGDFKKLAVLRELRANDATRNETQSLNLHRMQGSMVGNPIITRIYNESGEGGWFSRNVMVSGRKQLKDKNGKPDIGFHQSILSDGISDYLGTLWAHPRKMFTAASMARDAIYSGAVDAANWMRGSMVIDGRKVSGSMKELKGLYKESLEARLAQSRFSLIMDAAERRRLPDSDPRNLAGDKHTAQLEKIGKLSQPVTESEINIIELFLDSRERIATEKAVAQKSLAEVLEKAKGMGTTEASQITSIVNKLNKVLEQNKVRTLDEMNSNGLAASTAANKRSTVRLVRDENGKPKLDADGKVIVEKEGSYKGEKAQELKKPVNEKEGQTIADGKVLIIVKDGMPVHPGTADEAVIGISIKGVVRGFNPSKDIVMDANGDVFLFGTKVGKWTKSGDHKVIVTAKGIEEGMRVTEFGRLLKRKAFREAHYDILEKNASKMAEEPHLKAGESIAPEQSNTAAVNDAMDQLRTPGKLSEVELDKHINDFAPEDGFILVMKSTVGPEVGSPGPLQGGMTVRAFAKLMKIDPDKVVLGYIKEELLKSGELRGKSRAEKLGYKGIFTPIGATMPTADSAVVKKVIEKRENAPMVLEGQRRALSIYEAEKLKFADGSSLAEMFNEFRTAITGVKLSRIDTIDKFNAVLAELREEAGKIDALAPHGIRTDNASRATAFHTLQTHLAAYPKAELESALDMLRRMDTTGRGLPEFHAGKLNEFFSENYGVNNGIRLTTDPTNTKVESGVPKHVVVAHEVGHWAFFNLLNPSEQVKFLESFAKFYDAEGKLSMEKMMDSMPAVKALEKENGVGTSIRMDKSGTNELFAWGFTSHVMKAMTDSAAPDGLWQRAIKLVKNVLSHFLTGKVDPELSALFEKIMPSRISDTKFDYSNFTERSTGKVGDISTFDEKARKAGPVAAAMQKVDELRGKVRQHLLIPGAAADVGFAEDLRAAANHMFGLLYGRQDPGFVGKLRGKLNPWEDMSENAAKASGLKDQWLRDAKGRVVKFADKGLHVTALRPGIIDHSKLFNRSETGKLVNAIKDIMPAEAAAVSDQIAFEAVEAAAKFEVVLRDSSVAGNPSVKYAWEQALQQEFKRITGLEMRDTPAASAAKYSDALDRAVKFAYKEAESVAKDDTGVGIHDSLFDQNGDVLKLGTSQQRDVFMATARSLHDLMSDALTYMETEVRSRGVDMKAVDRIVEAPDANVSKAAEQAVAKLSKRRKKTVEPKTEKGAEVASTEAKERVDGVDTGVPVAAPPQVKAVVARVPHRDPEQAGIIGAAMTRIIKFIQKGDELTNADIARITGVKIEDGYKAEAMVNSTTEAFDALRKGLRWVSENMTNPNGKPKAALDYIADLLVRDRLEHIIDDLGSVQGIDGVKGVTGTILRGEKMVPINFGTVRAELGRFVKGEPVDDMLRPHLNDILADAKHVLSDLGKTAEAQKVAGPAVSTGGSPVLRFSNGSYHPTLVKSSVTNRLSNLTEGVASNLVDMLGLKSNGGTTADTLSRNIAYRLPGTSKVFTTIDQMLAGTDTPSMAALNLEIGNAMAKGDHVEAKRLLALYEANSDAPGVTPVFVDMNRIYDPVMATEDQKLALEVSRNGASIKDGLKDLGYHGILKGEEVSLFSMKHVNDMEKSIATSVGSAKQLGYVSDAPLTGEIALGLLASDGALPNPLAVEQRAILAGAPSSIAEILSRPFKRSWDKAAVTGEDAQKIGAFHGLQLSSNSARIRKVGGGYLADKIQPVNGTGFQEAFTTRLSTMLTPLTKRMDEFALGGSRWTNNWLGKAGYEVVRNLDIRHHAVPQSKSEARIAMAMRMNDLSHLTPEERAFAERLNNHFEELLNMQHKANIPVGDVRDRANRYYLPQRFNLDWIRANYDESIDMLAKWFEKDRAGTTGAGKSREDAARVINEAINREELQGVLDGASSTYTQAFGDKLHQRKLHIVGKDWEAMAPMFDQNLRSLVTSYSEAAVKRMEWADAFGIRGHAMATYTDIAENGSNSAIDALMGKAGGMKRVYDKPGMENDLVGQYAAKEAERDVEAVSNLFSAVTADPNVADKLVSEIMAGLKAGEAKETIIDKLVQYHTKSGGFGTDEFTKRAAAIVNGLADFGADGKSIARHEVDFMRKMVGVLGGRPAYTFSANQGARSAAGALKMFNSVTLLGGAVLGSLADPAMSLMRSGSAKAWLGGTAKAIKIAMNDQAYIEAMYRVGVTMESVISENLSNMSGGMTGRFNNAFFNANLLTPWTNANRQVAALVGFESIKANQTIALRERLTGNTDSWAYRKSIKYLRELGLGELATAEKLGDFPEAVTNPNVAKAIHRFTNEAIFQPNRNDMPLWTQDPIASIFWQFKSYPTMMGRLAKKNFKDAISFENGNVIDKLTGKEVGKYDGDPMGLVYLLSIGAAFGAGGIAVKETVYGKNSDNPDNPHSPRAHTISKMVQEMGFKDFDLESPGADLVVGEIASGLLGLGALGFLGDMMYQSAKSVDNGAFGRERIMSQIFGPSFGTATDMIQIVDGVRMNMKREDGEEFATSQERNAVRKVVKRIPVAGSVEPWVETFINGTVGPLENPPAPTN